MTRRKQPRPVAPQRPPGFRPKVRTREITCDWSELEPDEGSPPLQAVVRKNLTFAEVDNIPTVMRLSADGEATIIHVDDALRKAIAPYVLEWNATAVNLTTGEVEFVPPPAEIGLDAFRPVDWMIAAWLGVRLKNSHREIDLPKSKPPVSTDETSGDTASV